MKFEILGTGMVDQAIGSKLMVNPGAVAGCGSADDCGAVKSEFDQEGVHHRQPALHILRHGGVAILPHRRKGRELGLPAAVEPGLMGGAPPCQWPSAHRPRPP